MGWLDICLILAIFRQVLLSHVEWEPGLREAIHQALLRERYTDPSLRDHLLAAPLVGRQKFGSPFGDVAVLARGQLYANSGGYKLVQEPNDCDDCHYNRCQRPQCQPWKFLDHNKLVALWTVKRIRHRDSHHGHVFEIEYTISPITSEINEELVLRGGYFNYNVPGHIFVIKSDPKLNEAYYSNNNAGKHAHVQGHFRPGVVVGGPDGYKQVLHSLPGFYTSFRPQNVYEDQTTVDPKEYELYKKLIESLASKTATPSHRFSLTTPREKVTTLPTTKATYPFVQLPTGQVVPLTEANLPLTTMRKFVQLTEATPTTKLVPFTQTTTKKLVPLTETTKFVPSSSFVPLTETTRKFVPSTQTTKETTLPLTETTKFVPSSSFVPLTETTSKFVPLTQTTKETTRPLTETTKFVSSSSFVPLTETTRKFVPLTQTTLPSTERIPALTSTRKLIPLTEITFPPTRRVIPQTTSYYQTNEIPKTVTVPFTTIHYYTPIEKEITTERTTDDILSTNTQKTESKETVTNTILIKIPTEPMKPVTQVPLTTHPNSINEQLPLPDKDTDSTVPYVTTTNTQQPTTTIQDTTTKQPTTIVEYSFDSTTQTVAQTPFTIYYPKTETTEETTTKKYRKTTTNNDIDDIFGIAPPISTTPLSTTKMAVQSDLAEALFGGRRAKHIKITSKLRNSPAEDKKIIYSDFYQASTATPSSLLDLKNFESTTELKPSTDLSYSTSISLLVNKRNATVDLNAENDDTKKAFDNLALQLVNHARTIDYLSEKTTKTPKYNRRRNYVPKNKRSQRRRSNVNNKSNDER